jgi:hypothetical protein
MALKQTGCESIDWIQLAPDRVKSTADSCGNINKVSSSIKEGKCFD